MNNVFYLPDIHYTYFTFNKEPYNRVTFSKTFYFPVSSEDSTRRLPFNRWSFFISLR